MTTTLPTLPLSAEEPVRVGDILVTGAARDTGVCHLVQMIRECDCPHYGSEPPHLHFVCTPVEAGTWKRLHTGQTYQGGYRYEGSRLLGKEWPVGSDQSRRNAGERDELFLVWREPVPEPVQAAVKARPADCNATLTLEGMTDPWRNLKPVPQAESPDWWCDHCKRPQRGKPQIYNVPLCFLCIGEVASRPDRAYHAQCRLFELERENARLTRLVGKLRAGAPVPEGPYDPLGPDRHTKLTAIGFAALICAHGKPIRIEQAWIDALPEHFSVYIDVSEAGRIFRIEADTDASIS